MAKTKYNPDQLYFDFDVVEKDIFLLGDIHNIRHMLPKLLDHQHEDVARAEKRFEAGGKGYLFTNGTGTGKTYVGCGIAWRFYNRGFKDILIIVPSDAKCEDWIEEGHNLGLSITKLKDTTDAGKEISVTTYANFYSNDALNIRKFALVIYDESHKLGQNQKGEDTVYFNKHKHVANLPSQAKRKAMDILGDKPRFNYDHYQTLNEQQKVSYKEQIHFERHEWDQRYNHLKKEFFESTKVIFLSATPFAYHKSIFYADGCLFNIHETLEDDEEEFLGYNEAGKMGSFMIDNFGYRMRYNKITIPESGVDVDLMERNFFEKMKQEGVASTRILELPFDYSRDFIILDSEIGEVINTGIEMIRSEDFRKEYPTIHEVFYRKYNYTYLNQMLEVIKAQLIHKRIQQHLDLGRKVVIFHGYNHSEIEHPFRWNSERLISKEDASYIRRKLREEEDKFSKNFPEYYNLNLSNLLNTRQAIKKYFPHAREFNGLVNKKLRNVFKNEFNDDDSGINVMIVQQDAGKEGVSLHDKTGVHQRALITLGLPVAPVTAIQTEGRIYREGLKSNAVYEYATLQTSTEREAFGFTIATRARTAENLAMGNLARDLETAFKEGYQNATDDPPSLKQGVGGKEKDKALNIISEYQKAITYYYANQKRNAKNKSKEGKDYFATPEPLGYKMVEWLNPTPGTKGLEPSAGHGAIARFFPGDCSNTFIEPSYDLFSKLSVNAKGRMENSTFESFSIMNKYEFIAMNPPFGNSGSIAITHLEKAITKHMAIYGKVIAIIPRGAMDKKVDDFIQRSYGKNFFFAGEILLPQCTFERAGTNVSCRIVKFEHSWNEKKPFKSIDLTYIKDIKDFFEQIENLEF